MNRIQRLIARIAGLPIPRGRPKPLAFDIEKQILESLRAGGLIPPGVEPEIVVHRPGIKPPHDPAIDDQPWTWQQWQACMND